MVVVGVVVVVVVVLVDAPIVVVVVVVLVDALIVVVVVVVAVDPQAQSTTTLRPVESDLAQAAPTSTGATSQIQVRGLERRRRLSPRSGRRHGACRP